MSELRECRFCESKKVGENYYVDQTSLRVIHCSDCDAAFFQYEKYNDKEQDAAWNTRPREDRLLEVLREVVRIAKRMPMSDLEFREQNIIAKLPDTLPHPIEEIVNLAVEARAIIKELENG